jgi:hypothetical protein
MRRTLPRAATDCEDRPSATSQNDKGIAMWWNEDGSPVGGWYGTTSRDQQQALAEWRHVVTAD